ncbi:MAG TPA: type II toxin-antitoxin system ParD family antitoxin [Bryobacteraceae bacterium]|jgi:antitoxin ParD1/3/4
MDMLKEANPGNEILRPGICYRGEQVPVMNVSLTPELENFVQGQIQSGRYTSASDVIVEALLFLREHDETRTHQLKEFRERLDRGLDSLNQGEGVDGDSFMQGLLETVQGTKDKPKAG